MLTTVTVNWNPVVGADRYKVFIKRNNISIVNGTEVQTNSFQGAYDLLNGDVLTVQVASGSAAGFSPASTPVDLVVQSVPAIPPAPTGIVVTEQVNP